jgi:transcriptional regulator with XRE-family HTH domain
MAICIMIHEMKILRDKMSEIGMTQEFLAKKIGVTGVHLSKVLNGIASLTPQNAEKIANIQELQIPSAQTLLFPPQPLELSGQVFTNLPVELFKFDRLHIDLPSVRPGWYGIVYRGASDPDSSFHFEFDEGLVHIFDSKYQRLKQKDERAYNHISIIQRSGDQKLYVGWLGYPNIKTNKHPFQLMHSTSTLYIEIDWCSILEGSVNLKALNLKPY